MPDHTMREHAQGEGFDLDEIHNEATATARLGDPSLAIAIAIAPIILVIATNLLFVQIAIPRMDTSYLAFLPGKLTRLARVVRLALSPT